MVSTEISYHLHMKRTAKNNAKDVHAHYFRPMVGLIPAFLLLVGLTLAACTMPSVQGGLGSSGGAPQLAGTVREAYIDVRVNQVQVALERSIQSVNKLALLENDVETLCTNSEDAAFFPEFEELQAEHERLLGEGSQQLQSAQDVVKEADAWVAEEARKSDETAKRVEHFQWQLSQAQAGLENAAELIAYEQKVGDVRSELGSPPTDVDVGKQDEYYQKTWAAYSALEEIEAPQCMADLHTRFAEIMEQAGTFYYNASLFNRTSELDRRSLLQARDWFVARDKLVLGQRSWVAARQYAFSCDLMKGGLERGSAPSVEYRAIERISPNLYNSLDSVLDVTICAAEPQDVVMTVEVAGLTLLHTTKFTLQPGVNYFELKPELLPSLTPADLESAFTTQLNFTLSSTGGDVVDAQSAHVEVLTLYDYLWYNDTFGYAAQYELFAWLRPGSKEIDDLNRRAADYVGQWTDGQFSEINGYQYGEDWYGTLLQVAAIQKAFSDYDIAYIIDTYTPRADQRVLTCAAVFDRKQALCIESSLVMASALLSAGMHPFVIITPGHAQVAVETWEGSGRYFLIETTELPYSGLDRGIDSNSSWAYNGLVPVYSDGAGDITWVESGGTSDVWARYFNLVEDFESDTYGGIFVLDCSLQRFFGIHGIESM